MNPYHMERVDISEFATERATWAFAEQVVRGSEYRYRVIDGNHRSRNRWLFSVRVPDNPYGRIEVRPLQTPNDKAYAGLDRRSLTFMRGTRRCYRQFRYCPLTLAIPGTNGRRDLVDRRQKSQLPAWLRRLGWRLKQKATVRTTRGTDAHSLVVLVRPGDYASMIRIFLATKAWVLKREVVLD